jgi:copper chaperone
MTKAVFQLEEVTCPSCIKKIEGALNKVGGVISAKVLFNSSKVKVEFDESRVQASKLEQTIRNLGYLVLSSKVS